MNRLTGVLIGVLVTLADEAAAQGRGHMIAYDRCLYTWDDVGPPIACDVFLIADGMPNANPDGSRNIRVGDGAEPAWSRDGSRLAFAGSREAGIFVLNLGDWSLKKILNGGGSPTWAPNGTKLAIAGGELYVINADGSGLTQLTSSEGFIGQPDWSPDGATIAFDCEIDSGNLDICSINADGTGLARLTSEPAADSGAAFSPDGLTIAFTKTHGQNSVIASMNSDGTGMQTFFDGFQPAWSPGGMLATVHPWQAVCNADNICLDYIYVPTMHAELLPRGNRPAWALSVHPVAWFVSQGCNELTCGFDGSGSWGGSGTVSYGWNFGDGTSGTGPAPTHDYVAGGTYTVTLTVTDGLGVVGTQTREIAVVNNAWPTASFTYLCDRRQCAFDGGGSSDPEGPIAAYFWSFGDGETSSFATASHTYQADGAFTVSLTVTDGAGGTGTQQHVINVVNVVNAPPIASFTVSCAGVTCTFDASGSSDSDGTIAAYGWAFGDATAGSGATVSHTYAAAGTYTVTLTVTDNAAATSTHAQSVAAVSQNVVTRIAHDQCGPDLNVWDVACDIHVLLNGTYDLRVPAGVGPKWSPDGSKIAFTGSSYYYANPSFGLDEIVVVNLVDGSVANLTHHPARDVSPAWSRDGRQIAFVSDRDGPADLYVINSDGGNPTRLTNNIGFTGNFAWSPDGGRIAFAGEHDGWPELYVMAADGSNRTRVTDDVGFRGELVWSRDGGRIAFACQAENGRSICVINADGTNFVRLTSHPGYDSEPAFSPVDDSIVFTTGTGEIAVIDANGVVSLVGAVGSQPVWSPDGNRLAFVGMTTSWLGRCYLDEGAHPADDFCMAVPDIYTINLDGTGLSLIGNGGGIDWFTPPPGRPTATFTPDCTGSTCDFDASGSFDSDGTITSYVWQFGDGTSGSGATASHTYSPGGQYRVTLTVTDNTGATGMLIMHVDANAPPVASFTVACVGPTCTFDASGSSDPDGTIRSYRLSFGDGGAAYLPNATHTYATGTFSVGLYVVDDGGAWDTARQTVSVVNAPPVASFTHSCSGLSCTFDGSGSSDPDGTITRYSWSFGDGTIASAPSATMSYTYAAAGTYTVTLTATGNNQGTGSQSRTVTVANVNAPPVASFTFTCSMLACSFNASGSSDPDGTIASYAWNFGDGTTGSGATVNRAYAAGGTYTVTLAVTDNAAATSQTASVVNVNAPPIASFTSACSGLVCSFNASGSSDPGGAIVSYAWSFGDSTTGSGATVNRTYTAAGTYTVRLSVTDNGNATSTLDRSVTVVQPPIHVGDLDRSKTKQSTSWTAVVTISVHGSSHGPLANAAVSGSWNDGSLRSCTTNASGQCTVSKSGIPTRTSSVSFTVTNVTRAAFAYTPAANHDPDGDSNGSTITVTKP